MTMIPHFWMCVLSDARVWTPYEFELRDHAGKTVRLYFDAFNNGNRGVTAMYVDDVSLQVCPAQ